MSQFGGPSPRRQDRRLFNQPTSSAAKLHRQSRKELRQQARQTYWQAKQAREAAEAQA